MCKKPLRLQDVVLVKPKGIKPKDDTDAPVLQMQYAGVHLGGRITVLIQYQ
jgi:hypothetical protein